MRLILLMLMGCSGKGGPKGDSGGNGGDGSPWNVVADDVPGGVLLSAWSDGDTLRMIGGDLGGGPGLMVRGDGESLCYEPEVTDRALWWIHGPAAGEWYAVGENGTVLQAVGETRTRIDVPTDATLFGVWADQTHVWVAGGHIGSGLNEGEIWRWDGTDWEEIATGLPGVLFKVWDGWFVGQDVSYRWDGTDLVSLPTPGRLLTVRGRADEDVWSVGGLAGPLVVHWEDDEWVSQDTTGLNQAINGVWTAPGEDIWIAGNFGTQARWTGSDWEQPEMPLTTDHLHAVWRHKETTYWMGGDLFNVGDNHGVILRHGAGPTVSEMTECTD